VPGPGAPEKTTLVLVQGSSPDYTQIALTLGLVLLTLPGDALAASPEPTAIAGSDTRSGGEGPGIVGEPLTAALAVIGIGALSTLVTIAFVRLTGGRQSSNPER